MKLLHAMIATSLATGLAGCTTVVRERVAVRPIAPVPAPPVATAVVIRQMPPPMQELPGPPPGPGFSWVQGHWVWQNTAWAWQPGHWDAGQVQAMPPLVAEQITVAPGPGYYWVPGHWQWHRGRWEWRRGHWRI